MEDWEIEEIVRRCEQYGSVDDMSTYKALRLGSEFASRDIPYLITALRLAQADTKRLDYMVKGWKKKNPDPRTVIDEWITKERGI